eukprot:SAG31_NODE_22197_length_531_cov_1.847222_1_plen_172_part_10
MPSSVTDKYLAVRAAQPDINYPQIGSVDQRPITLRLGGGSSGNLRESVYTFIGDRQRASAMLSVCDKTPNTTIFYTRFFEGGTPKVEMTWVRDMHCLVDVGGPSSASCPTNAVLSGDKQPLIFTQDFSVQDSKPFDMIMLAASRDPNDMIVAGQGDERIFPSPWTVLPMLFV